VRRHVLLQLGNYNDVQRFGVEYSKFSLGFHTGHGIMKFYSRGTEFILGWFPSGGYVKIDGLSDESLDDGPPPDPNDRKMLFTRNIGTRLVIVNGGHLIIAIILIVLLFCLGNEGISTQTYGLSRIVVANFDAWWGNIEIADLQAKWDNFTATRSLALSATAFVFMSMLFTTVPMSSVHVLQGSSNKAMKSLTFALNIMMMLLFLAMAWPICSLVYSVSGGFESALGLIFTTFLTIQLGFILMFIILRIVLPKDKYNHHIVTNQ
jgi:hypothetical protein